MYSTAKDLDGFGQVCCVGKCDQGLLVTANVLDVLERNWLPLTSLPSELIKGCDIAFVRMCEADYEEEVCIQVAIVECACGMASVGVFTEQDHIGCVVLHQNAGGVLDAGTVLDEPHQCRVYDFP